MVVVESTPQRLKTFNYEVAVDVDKANKHKTLSRTGPFVKAVAAAMDERGYDSKDRIPKLMTVFEELICDVIQHCEPPDAGGAPRIALQA